LESWKGALFSAPIARAARFQRTDSSVDILATELFEAELL
jgi:hypothetical protein